MSHKKRVIILEHGGGELSNQLWNFISIYAYCRERGYNLENYSFFEYSPWFRVGTGNLLVRLLFFWPFILLKSFGGYRTMAASVPFRILKKAIRFVYGYYARIIKIVNSDCLASSEQGVVHLDASGNILDDILAKHDTVYCSGWLFRNAAGIQKYREQIRNYLQPREPYLRKTKLFMDDLRKQYTHVIGAHIRQRNPWDTSLAEQQDCDLWGSYDAKPFFYESHFQFIQNFLKEYAVIFNKDLAKTCFVICSNKVIEPDSFPEIHCVFHGGILIEDILALSECDAIIGSNSTLSAFASWWGNIAMVPMQEKPDWEYYRGLSGYVEDKKITAVHY